MLEALLAALIVAVCAVYWARRLFPVQFRAATARLGLAPKQVIPASSAHSACGSCRRCGGGGCH